MPDPSGSFSPIEAVIAEAERRAIAEWNREHSPCPHHITYLILSSRCPRCAECGAEVADPEVMAWLTHGQAAPTAEQGSTSNEPAQPASSAANP